MRFPCFAVIKNGKMTSFASLEENAKHAATPGSKVLPCVIIPRSECEQSLDDLTCFEARVIFKLTEKDRQGEKSLDILFIADNKKDASFYGMHWAKNRSEQLTKPGEKWEPIRVDVGAYHIGRPNSDGYVATKREMIPFFQWRADRDKPFGESLVTKLAEANNPKDNPATVPGEWIKKPTVGGLYWALLRNDLCILNVAIDKGVSAYWYQGAGYIDPNEVTRWMLLPMPPRPEVAE